MSSLIFFQKTQKICDYPKPFCPFCEPSKNYTNLNLNFSIQKLTETLKVQCPSPKLSPVYIIIASLLCVTAPCSFFLCLAVYLGMLHKTKTVCVVGFVPDRKHYGCKNISQLPLLHFS